ncbi:MAG: hypothetical protein WA840_04000 [Caulobacteraceae bacterium]
MADTTTRKNPFEELFEQPFVAPEGSQGIGPTLGMDLAAHDAEDLGSAPEEPRSFAPADEQVLRGARSA